MTDEVAAVAAEAPAAEPTILGGAIAESTPTTDVSSGAAASEKVADAPAGADPGEAEGDSTLSASPAPEEEAPAIAPAEPLTADSYTDALTVPEGFTVDDTLMGQFRESLAASGVDPTKAQGLLDVYVASQRAQQQTFADTQQRWQDEVRAMPEFTGEAAAKSTASLGRMMEEFGNDDVRAILSATGAGNHPAMVKFMLGVANALSEGAPTRGGGPAAAAQPKTPGQALYPTQQ